MQEPAWFLLGTGIGAWLIIGLRGVERWWQRRKCERGECKEMHDVWEDWL